MNAGRLRATLLAVVVVLVAAAHVGTDAVVYDGAAGAYPVRVVVRMPQVVPGQAEVSVRLMAKTAVSDVGVQPVFWETGIRGAPPPEHASSVRGDRSLYTASVWLMTSGSYGIRVLVRGSAGMGETTVPVEAMPLARLGMRRALAILLVLLGLVLAVGLVSVVRAAVADAVLPPGATMTAARRRRGRVAAVTVGAVLAIGSLGAARWWRAVDASFQRTIYRPLAVRTSIVPDVAGGPALHLTVLDSAWQARAVAPLVPDHGKLMHMFVVEATRLDAMVHLHPVPSDSSDDTWTTRLPPGLSRGLYRVYADVVDETGFARTLVDTVRVGATSAAPWQRADSDDAAWSGGADTSAARPDDGTAMSIDERHFRAGDASVIRAVVRDASGRPLPLEPYMGMAGHAVVANADGTVFAHLHPMGMTALASQALFERRERGDSIRQGTGGAVADSAFRAATMTASMAAPAGEVSFPFVFPRPGRYRVWIEVKHSGRIETGAFDVTVVSER